MVGLILSTTLDSYEDMRPLSELARYLYKNLARFSLSKEASDLRLRLIKIDFTHLSWVASNLHVFDRYLDRPAATMVAPMFRADFEISSEELRVKLNLFSKELRDFLRHGSPELQRGFLPIVNDLWHFAVLESVVALNELETPLKTSMVNYMRARDDETEKEKQLTILKSTLLQAHAVLSKATIDSNAEGRRRAALEQLEATLNELEVMALLRESEA